MVILEFIQQILNAAPGEGCSLAKFCPGSAMSAVAAAYGTQGIWVMADLVDQLIWTKLAALGPLMYVIAASGGIISLAIGAPPRTYLWFFLGPAIYRWLIGTYVDAKGMEWRVAGVPVDQAEVWRLSEVGLVNTAMAWKGVRGAGGARGGSSQIHFYKNHEPSEAVKIPYFFAYYDWVLSGTIQELIKWSGIYSQRKTTADNRHGYPGDNTSLPPELPSGTVENDRWFLLSNLKWGMIQNITDAKIQNPFLRTSLSRFFAGQCGDAFAKSIDSTAFAIALNGKGKTSPGSVLRRGPNSGAALYSEIDPWTAYEWGVPTTADVLDAEEYTGFKGNLFRTTVKMPRELRQFITDDGTASFRKAVNWGASDNDYKAYSTTPVINCANYFRVLVSGFRWEAAQVFHQLVSTAPGGLTRNHIVYNLLYGWDVRKWNEFGNDHLTNDEQIYFIEDLILVHMIRNEMAIVRPNMTQSSANPGQLSSEVSQSTSEGHLKFVASKNKSSEFYQWALMIPHMQGILLYYLAIGYPFACLLMILPGMHKTLFTWMSFWAWAKLWDLGFALVMALERSVWASLGSNSNIGRVFGLIANMQNWGHVDVQECVPGTQCAFTNITLMSGADTFQLTSAAHWAPMVRIFDRAMAVGANLDLDLQNSYYIYIMAGLYFAVPVVAGQLVLGGKAGAASLVNNVIGGVGSEAGRQAAAGYQSDLQTRMKSNFGVGSQEAVKKGMADSNGLGGLVGHALDAGNQQTALQAQAGFNNRTSAGLKTGAELAALQAQVYDTWNSNVVRPGADAVGRLGGAARPAAGGQTGGAGITPAAGGPQAGGGGGTAGAALTSGSGGATASGGGGNATGGGGTANGGGGFGGALGKLKGFAGNNLGALAGFGSAAWGSVPAEYNTKARMANAAMQTAEQKLGDDSWGKQSAASGYQLAGDRVGRQAGFEAEMAGWEWRNNYANAMSATAAALGGLPGGFEPGQMPTDTTALAMTGDGGEKLKKQANFSDPWGNGAYQQYLGGKQKELAATSDKLTKESQQIGRFAGGGIVNEMTGGRFGQSGEKILGSWGSSPQGAKDALKDTNPANNVR